MNFAFEGPSSMISKHAIAHSTPAANKIPTSTFNVHDKWLEDWGQVANHYSSSGKTKNRKLYSQAKSGPSVSEGTIRSQDGSDISSISQSNEYTAWDLLLENGMNSNYSRIRINVCSGNAKNMNIERVDEGDIVHMMALSNQANLSRESSGDDCHKCNEPNCDLVTELNTISNLSKGKTVCFRNHVNCSYEKISAKYVKNVILWTATCVNCDREDIVERRSKGWCSACFKVEETTKAYKSEDQEYSKWADQLTNSVKETLRLHSITVTNAKVHHVEKESGTLVLFVNSCSFKAK
uniref:GATA-type domain-containing protein n=1 Tax=Heterorhabditis bacteriophora TaxID=37862 RepID=A0A1I7XR79_HETBA